MARQKRLRDFETLLDEARALQADEAWIAWFSELTDQEQIAFFRGTASLIEEMRQLWEEEIVPILNAPALEMILENVSPRVNDIWEIVREKDDTALKALRQGLG